MTVTELIKRAAALLGGETKEAIGVSQNTIWQAKSRGRAHQLLADIIQRKGGRYQIGLCDDANGPFPSRLSGSRLRSHCEDAADKPSKGEQPTMDTYKVRTGRSR